MKKEKFFKQVRPTKFKTKLFTIILICVIAFFNNTIAAQNRVDTEEVNAQEFFFEDKNPLFLMNIGDADIALRYQKGEGVPIVFIHGSWDDHHSWLPVATQISSKINNPIILYDRKGHSASSPDKYQGSISQDVNDLSLLVNKLGFEKAHFIGHSYGANIAIQFAVQHSERVESVVLYEPPIFGLLKNNPKYKYSLKTVKTAMVSAKALLEKGEIEKGTIQFIERVAFGKGSWKNIFDDRARSTMLASYRTWLDQSNDPERLNIQSDKLNQFKRNITLITGTKSIAVYPAVVQELNDIVEKIQIKSILGAGHGGLVSHTIETTKLILEHLKIQK